MIGMTAMTTKSSIKEESSGRRRSGARWPDGVCMVIACSDLGADPSF